MATPRPRMTLPTQAVLRILLVEPAKALYGLELGAESGLASGTIHPILARFERIGWLESFWEDIDPREAGRPRRRYYRLTTSGAEKARVALSEIEGSALDRYLRFRPGPAEGLA